MASLLALAYSHSAEQPSSLVLPLLQCSRDELPLRRDVIWMLNELDIEAGELLFLEDVTLASLPSLTISLVDHNSPSSSLLPFLSSITECIDHHQDNHQLQCDDVIIEAVASCSSLVARQIYKVDSDQVTKEVASLLLGAILVDTTNLSNSKTTDTDKAMVELLEPLSLLEMDDLVNRLEDAHWDISELTTKQLLSSDCKDIEAGGCKVVFCIVRCLYSTLADRDADLEATIQQFCVEENADLVFLVLMDRGPPFRRQIGLFERSDVPPSKQDLAEGIAVRFEAEEEINVERMIDMMCGGIIFEQHNTNPSRKQLIPMVKNFM